MLHFRDLPDYEKDRYKWYHDGEGVDLYILDTGIDICHPDFEGRASYGMYTSSLDEGYVDLNGHGTHVASTAGGKRWGIAKKANLISCKVLGRFGVGSTFGILEGIDYVTDTVRKQRSEGKKPRPMINLSLGTFGFSQAMYDSLQEAWDEGVVNVAASGNNAGPASGMFPAAHDNVITIGSTNINDAFSGFSNHGCELAVSAPGSDITAAWSTQTPLCRNQRPLPEDCITSVSGTSMACPHAMGIIARHLSAMTDEEYEASTPKLMQDMLTATAIKDKMTFGAFPPNAEQTTTNRMLHKECEVTDWSPEDVYTPCPFVPPEPDDVQFKMADIPTESKVIDDNIVHGEYLIRLKAGHAPTSLKSMLGRLGARLVTRMVVAHKVVALVRTSGPGIDRVRNAPWVEHVEPNRKYHLIKPVDIKLAAITRVSPPTVTEELECHEQDNTNHTDFNIWGLIRTSYDELPNYEEDPYVWHHEGEGVDLYVLDTGIDGCHPDFDQRVTYGMYASNLDEGYVDLNGHGTHVASTAAGTNWGIAKKAHLYSCKVLGRLGVGQTIGIVEGVQFVSDRVRKQKAEGEKPRAVINLSLGGFAFSQILYDALQEAWDLGVVNVAASGNNAGPASGMFPAAHDNVITVGSTTSGDDFSAFSNHGCELAVSAPGSDITAAWSTETPLCQNLRPIPSDCITSVSGTSMASPHVMGVVARYLSSLTDEEFATTTPNSVQDMLTATATKDRITFGPLQGTAQNFTTNRLLHKTCGQTTWDPEDVYKTCPFSPPGNEDPEDPEDPEEPVTEEPEDPEDPGDSATSLGGKSLLVISVMAIVSLLSV